MSKTDLDGLSSQADDFRKSYRAEDVPQDSATFFHRGLQPNPMPPPQGLAHQILQLSRAAPEGALLTAKGLLHLGKRATVAQALSRLARRGSLLRIAHGLYVRPVESRFGVRAPTAESVVACLAGLRGETVGSQGAAIANGLGLTSQVPVRLIYLTTGRARKLKLGGLDIELRHAPAWQLILAGRPAGDVLRALAWLGPARAPAAIVALKRKLAREEFQALAQASPLLPNWMAQLVSQ